MFNNVYKNYVLQGVISNIKIIKIKDKNTLILTFYT